MTESSAERRNFQRVVMHKPATLSDASHAASTRLLDISLKGVLLEKPDDWQPSLGSLIEGEVQLSETPEFNIKTRFRITHSDGAQIGGEIVEIDIDSATRLRRLVELNLADPEELHRELEHLSAA